MVIIHEQGPRNISHANLQGETSSQRAIQTLSSTFIPTDVNMEVHAEKKRQHEKEFARSPIPMHKMI